MAESYKNRVKRKVSQARPSSGAGERIADIIAQNLKKENNIGSGVKEVKHAGVRNKSTVFEDERQGVSETKRALDVYKNNTFKGSK